MYVNKWAGFSVSVVCTCSAGLAYCFSLYSNQLKEAFGYDQRQIQAIGSATNLGGYASIISGLVYDSMLGWDGRGPRITLLIGVIVNIFGWVSLWAAAKGLIPAPFWLVLIIAGLTCNGGTWFDTACLVTSVRNFPNERGTVVGLLKACVGLSASVYTSIYVGFEEPDAITYLLYLAFIPAIVVMCSIPFVNFVPYTQKSELATRPQFCTTGGRFLSAYQIMTALAIYLMATAVMDQSSAFMLNHQTRMLLSIGTIILTLSILLVPIGSGGLASQRAESQGDEEDVIATARARAGSLAADPDVCPPGQHAVPDEHAPLMSTTVSDEDDATEEPLTPSQDDTSKRTDPDGKLAKVPHQKQLGQYDVQNEGGVEPTPSARAPSAGFVEQMPDMTLLQCCTSLNFWLLFLTCSIGMGSGLSFLNNLGQLVIALGGESDSQAVFVSLFSVSNCAGRLLLGYIPERLLHAHGTPRCVFLILISALSALAVCFNAFASLPLLFPASIMAGLAFGATWSLMATLTSEFFGLHHFASNYTFIQLAPAAGGFGLGQLVGSLYEKEAQKGGPNPGCYGHHCFRLSFLLIAMLDVVALISSTILYYRTRHIYKVEYEELHQHDEDLQHPCSTANFPTGGANMGHIPSVSLSNTISS
ncbi:TPA: hypothetical protein ACH3X2_010713 [Trebouxia sp. C0005]